MSWSKYAEFLAFAVVLSARRLLVRRKVRRSLDATTGAVLLGFGAKLATEHV